MKRPDLAVLVLVGAALLTLWWLRRTDPVSVPDHGGTAPIPAEPPVVEPRGRPPEPPHAGLLHSAQSLLGADGRPESCGPYALYTDVTESRFIDACGRLAPQLDALYEQRYGVRPLGTPAEAIVLFGEIESYRAFARESGIPMGYAGYTLAARGLAVFYADDEQPFATFLTTLTHELTHFLNRRALGVNLPPWLSEGLADGIGDTATEEGFEPPVGARGSEVQASRLQQALLSGHRSGLERLVRLKRSEFDRVAGDRIAGDRVAGPEAVSYDYEQSALFVRFLLSEPELAAGFRSFLDRVAKGAAPTPEHLEERLGIDWLELDRRFEAWVLGL